MKKTLVLTHEYFPFRGGVAYYVYNLFKFFPQDKYLVVTDNPVVKTADNIINLKLKHKFIRPTWLLTFFKIKKLIKQEKIGQILTPNILPLGSLAYVLKIPYIISLHGLDINLALKNKPHLTKLILKNAKLILVNSQNTKDKIKHLNLGNKVELFYPALDSSIDYDQDRLDQLKQKLNIQTDEKVLLTVGRLTHRKGHDLVLQALAKLKNLPLRYVIIGGGQEEENLNKLIKDLNLEKKVLRLAQVDDNDLMYYYKLADIFVMPNRQEKEDIEGFGMVFLEAANYQLSIIGGNTGGVNEILTDQKNALLINPEVGELVSAIKELINHPEKRKQLAEAAFSRSQEFASAEVQSKNLENLL